MAKTTWRIEISRAMAEHGETWDDLVACTLTDAEADAEFDPGYGTSEGAPFTAWSKARVYFPAVYDGAEDAVSVPRNPADEATQHIGGQ